MSIKVRHGDQSRQVRVGLRRTLRAEPFQMKSYMLVLPEDEHRALTQLSETEVSGKDEGATR
jgi:hypothetical protein